MKHKASEEFHHIRKEVRKAMIDLDLDLPGERKALIQKMSEKLGRKVSPAQFSMALTGYRNTNASQILLDTALSVMKGEESHESDHV